MWRAVDRVARVGVRHLVGVAGLLFLAGILLASDGAEGAEKVTGRLSVRDALTVPGRPVKIEAKLVRSGFPGQAGLGGEQLEFLVGGRAAGTAMTGGDGRAFLEYTARMRGNQDITVKLIPSKRVESPEATATLACWERRRPILLVDMESLAEETRAPRIPLPSLPIEIGHQERPAPASGAADELKRLTDYFFNVIYLVRSDRDEASAREDARQWLREHRFPAGLLMTMRPVRTALVDLVDRLRAEGWDNLKAGIGRTRDFAEALLELRLAVVIIPPSTRDVEVPSKARVAKDWKEVRKKL